ncbi:replication factor A protein 3 [Martensiomyces pterosporus]|nr:replication factor A protein 3 [Martensiomyces pterosporus]
MDKPTPRVNASMLSQYTNTTVRLVGRVVQSQGSGFVLETSDGNTVAVNPAVECTFTSNYIELLGKVQSDGTVNGFTAVDLSDSFDLDAYGLFERATHKCPDLFA